MPRRRKRRAARASRPFAGAPGCARPDWEGSRRLASPPSRTETGDPAYSPYGAAYAGTGQDAFTGHRVDAPDNLNDFQHRLLAPMMDRWLSPDPAGIAAASLTSPQARNEYAHVLNDPASSLDALGPDGYYLADCSRASPSGFHSHDGQLRYGDSPADQGISYQWLGPPFMQYGAPVNPLPGAGSGGIGRIGTIMGNGPKIPCLGAKFAKFFSSQFPAALPVANARHVAISLLLALAAHDTGWGVSSMSRTQRNPFGATPHGGHSRGLTFSSFGAAWAWWGKRFGPNVENVGANVAEFLNRLLHAGYNTLNANTGGDPRWATDIAAAVPSVDKRLGPWPQGAPICR
jgi:RHS repeat-associated protein